MATETQKHYLPDMWDIWTVLNESDNDPYDVVSFFPTKYPHIKIGIGANAPFLDTIEIYGHKQQLQERFFVLNIPGQKPSISRTFVSGYPPTESFFPEETIFQSLDNPLTKLPKLEQLNFSTSPNLQLQVAKLAKISLANFQPTGFIAANDQDQGYLLLVEQFPTGLVEFNLTASNIDSLPTSLSQAIDVINQLLAKTSDNS